MRITVPKKYKGARVVVVARGRPKPTMATLLLDPGVVYRPARIWIGSWSIDRKKKVTIYLQKVYVDAVKKHGSKFRLYYTLEHEFIESKIAERSLSNLERVAHQQTIRKMHASSRRPIETFRKMEERELRELGFDVAFW